MLRAEELYGVYVPIITPFDRSGELDLHSYRTQLVRLLDSGVHGIVVGGTTGESPTIAADEWEFMIKAALETMAKRRRVPLVVGTGTNDTAMTAKRTERAAQLGADAALVVVPYYSRPSQEGIAAHFRRISSVGLPVIAYDIPARTGVGMTLDTARAILELDGVIGLKDSSGGVGLVAGLSRHGTKPVLCGEDALFDAMMCCGARGGILAAANVRTRRFVDVFNDFAAGRTAEAKRSFGDLLPLIRLLFQETNPAPLKWLLARQGVLAADALRLPLTPIGASLRQELERYADESGC